MDSKYNNLVKFWNNAFKISDEDKKQILNEYQNFDYKELAPSLKLYEAVANLKSLNNVLDYGCGDGWASVIAAKNNSNVFAVDVIDSGLELLELYKKVFNVERNIKTLKIDSDWLSKEKEESYDAIVCSNVLDVLPNDMSNKIIDDFARIIKKGGILVIGLNYYIDPSKAKLNEDNELYIDGVLRLLNKSDEEWSKLFKKYFEVEKLEHFAWAGEETEKRRLFYLKKN